MRRVITNLALAVINGALLALAKHSRLFIFWLLKRERRCVLTIPGGGHSYALGRRLPPDPSTPSERKTPGTF